jgi:hypothetical protein
MKRSLILLLAVVAWQAWGSEVKVTCPQSLEWSSEGYCKLDFDKLKTPTCPRGSHLDQPSVTGPRICTSKGSCPDGLQTSKRGICVKK